MGAEVERLLPYTCFGHGYVSAVHRNLGRALDAAASGDLDAATRRTQQALAAAEESGLADAVSIYLGDGLYAFVPIDTAIEAQAAASRRHIDRHRNLYGDSGYADHLDGIDYIAATVEGVRADIARHRLEDADSGLSAAALTGQPLTAVLTTTTVESPAPTSFPGFEQASTACL
ncbi:hypothetical protein ACQP2U_43435 (plasmid) [Nocardia sp. CA-084685]|uniref:hypothetical protein n=1 Tax=Nocardia sp. CA-084685 TaxID=3239970 RepID=UPI003D989F18